jgi:hypothetical protein
MSRENAERLRAVYERWAQGDTSQVVSSSPVSPRTGECRKDPVSRGLSSYRRLTRSHQSQTPGALRRGEVNAPSSRART